MVWIDLQRRFQRSDCLSEVTHAVKGVSQVILLVSDGVDSIQFVLDLRQRLALSDPAAREIDEEAVAPVNVAKHFPFDQCLGRKLELANQNSDSVTLKDVRQFLFSNDFTNSRNLSYRREDDTFGRRQPVPNPFEDFSPASS